VLRPDPPPPPPDGAPAESAAPTLSAAATNLSQAVRGRLGPPGAHLRGGPSRSVPAAPRAAARASARARARSPL